MYSKCSPMEQGGTDQWSTTLKKTSTQKFQRKKALPSPDFDQWPGCWEKSKKFTSQKTNGCPLFKGTISIGNTSEPTIIVCLGYISFQGGNIPNCGVGVMNNHRKNNNKSKIVSPNGEVFFCFFFWLGIWLTFYGSTWRIISGLVSVVRITPHL